MSKPNLDLDNAEVREIVKGIQRTVNKKRKEKIENAVVKMFTRSRSFAESRLNLRKQAEPVASNIKDPQISGLANSLLQLKQLAKQRQESTQ